MARKPTLKMISTALDAHLKDCAMFRKDQKRERAMDRRQQQKMHDENSARADKADEYREEISKKLGTLGGNVGDLSNNVSDLKTSVTTLKQKETKEQERRRFWWNRAREAAIAALFLACCYMGYHILITKNLTP